MTSERPSASTTIIIGLLIANLGLSAYIALRALPVAAVESSKTTPVSDITSGEATKLSESVILLYNAKNVSDLYDRFDPLAKVQIAKEQFTEQMKKLDTVIGRIENCAYSHATIAGKDGGRTYYTLHYKVSLSGGPFNNGDMTITVVKNADGLGLFGFFINGTVGQRSQ